MDLFAVSHAGRTTVCNRTRRLFGLQIFHRLFIFEFRNQNIGLFNSAMDSPYTTYNTPAYRNYLGATVSMTSGPVILRITMNCIRTVSQDFPRCQHNMSYLFFKSRGHLSKKQVGSVVHTTHIFEIFQLLLNSPARFFISTYHTGSTVLLILSACQYCRL
jgi:hypothetical protein